MKAYSLLIVVFLFSLSASGEENVAAKPDKSVYAGWTNGSSTDPGYYPIAVWLQDPKNAERFKAIGINLYIGLWKGPTEEQLAALKKVGMPVICSQNDVALKHLDDKLIVAWMHGDEPDNAQSKPDGKGYGPPIPPSQIVADYKRIKAVDPSRPVMLNLGQGVAWDGWYGRGVRTNHPEDYAEYVKGGDIVSFDIYPAVHDRAEVAGKLWFVAQGVERLRKWTEDKRIVWDCIECTRISNVKVKPTPHQVRAEVWMSIIHGSRGLIYFVHQFKPKFVEPALLEDAEMVEAVTALNKQIRTLGTVINSAAVADAATVASSSADVPIQITARKHGGAMYLFAVAMRDGEATATFTVTGAAKDAKVEVIDETRTLSLTDGRFTDSFKGYDAHLYRIK